MPGKPVALVGAIAKKPAPEPVTKASTLQLAAKGGQIETLERLIALGARLDEPGTSPASIKSLISSIGRGLYGPALRRLFLAGAGPGARLVHQLTQEHRDEALLELMRGCVGHRMRCRASRSEYLEFARVLLDAGADPDCCRLDREGISSSTLSFAVLSRPPETVSLLLDRGAHVNGPPDAKLPRRPRLPLHVPLCAVAHAMAADISNDEANRDALVQTVQALLGRGADINVRVLFRGSALHTDRLTSPLLIFLNSTNPWDAHDRSPKTIRNLRFLLDGGASPVAPPVETTSGLFERRNQGRWNWCAPDADVVRALLDYWVAGHPSRRRQLRATAEALAAYDYPPALPKAQEKKGAVQKKPAAEQVHGVIAGWRAVLGSVIDSLSASERSDFLYFYIVRKGTCPEHRARLCNHLSRHRSAGVLARATVAFLLQSGADVNHRVRQPGSEQERDREGRDGPTALHSICLWLAGRDPGEEGYEHLFGNFHPKCMGFRHTRQRLQFVRFLVGMCGADAGALHDGRAPAEVLEQLTRQGLDEQEVGSLWWQRDAETVRQARGSFVELLRGAAAAAGSR
ncbi:hypothetical protein MAPG_07262 [Magnaporthiopsis poae ATCC 64411]|uniref:Uncharacterized protein n=1 Tax=Magnaporthiopsis poae (strain ATCC 64411 / 73-15) TaxID=644358 RepID=A0A0C4E473_MAGP6|nr:hypothetical protein MAPG_07262 [Magnaporthiopsis poae ATCC 64411]